MEYIFNTFLALTSYWLITRFPCCRDNRGSLDIGKLLEYDDKLIVKRKQKIGNITYIISSVFNQKAKGDVIEKVSRLIDRETANISLDDVVNK